MNSEELEQSLRTEFESYLKNVLADMRQEVSQFRQKIDSEVESHKVHLDEVYKNFSAKLEQEADFDEGFKEAIIEHLRLARDEGATITATAIAEAEELAKVERQQNESVATEPSSAYLSDIRDAIYDISSQSSQSAILKALIDHASKYTARGAFFVVKNQHFVGWRTFGNRVPAEDAAIGEVVFPVASATVLGDAVRSLSVIESAYGNYPDDAEYLIRLDFGKPPKMYAIPLIARGRGVAAIYADCGDHGEEVNVEALETLVSVAGLTVELLAAAQNSQLSRGAVRTIAHTQAETQPASEHISDETESETAYAPEPEAPEAAREIAAVEAEIPRAFAEPQEVVKEDVEEVEVESSSDAAATDFESADAEAQYEAVSEPVAAHEMVEPVMESADAAYTEELSSADVEEPSEDRHAQPDTVEEVAKGESEPATEAAEADVVTIETEPVSEVSEVSTEHFDSFSSETDAEYDDSRYDKPVEIPGSSDSFAVTSASEPEFETNQDFNSSPVQFEQSADVFESADSEFPVEATPEETTVEATPEETTVEAAAEETPVEAAPEEFPVEAAPEETVEEESAAAPAESFESFDISDTSGVEAPVVAAARAYEEAEAAEVVAEPAAAAAPVRTRFSDRNVDLPIDVSEEERRLHNDARRFARLLVSEIKLYNEQKVKEGRESNDLYERLREAIDRSREMYDKRVQPTVVKRFDYFHFEVVNNLADGEEVRLGSAYPGATP